MYRSKLSSDTAFYKNLVASICIVILSNEITFDGFGSCGLKPDCKMLFWSYWGDSLDCGGGGGGGWTTDLTGYVLEVVPEVLTCFMISINFFLQYNLLLFWFSSNFPNLLQTSYNLNKTKKFWILKKNYLGDFLCNLSISVIVIIFSKHWFCVLCDLRNVTGFIDISTSSIFHGIHFFLYTFDFSFKLIFLSFIWWLFIRLDCCCHVIFVKIKR